MTSTIQGGRTLEDLHFTNSFAQLPDVFFERRTPSGIPNAVLAAFNPDAAALIGLQPGQETRDAFVRVASGNGLLPAMEPVAAIYAGHQFGSFVPQLGDGRAILLGEIANARGESWELQLKGAGLTAFSRFGDGRAVLRSTIREYLASEALHHLGVPSTRALAMTSSDEPVLRETRETAAVLVRMAPTFVRFGSFELFHYRNNSEAVKTLADYVIERWFHEAGNGDDRYERFFHAVVTRTAELMAAWQSVGFAHGVMNTDNFSIVGLTLDYGPYGFLDAYDPGFICNHTDQGGRYAFDRQPTIGLWNCYALANALISLIDKSALESVLNTYEASYNGAYKNRMRAKFGLTTERDEDAALILDVLELLEGAQGDYTRFFRALCELDIESSASDDILAAFFEDRDGWYAWQTRYRARLALEPQTVTERRAAKRTANPKYILRNYLAQTAIERAQAGDFSEVARLHDILRHPYDEQPENDAYAAAPPQWAKTISVSCSS